MAVYTHVERDQINEFLNHYDVGTLVSFDSIEQGVENSNYHLETTTGRYILTLFEKRVKADDLPFFFAFTDHLAAHGIHCPTAIADLEGGIIRTLAGRPTVIISFLKGRDLPADKLTPAHCLSLGEVLGKMHKAALSFDQGRDNAMSFAGWKDLAARTANRADEVMPGLKAMIADELAFLEKNWPAPNALPRAAIHADVFPDNVFYDGKTVSGVIDFYFACTDFLAYDLGIVVNAWCFDSKGKFLRNRLDAIMDGYKKTQRLVKAEQDAMSILCRGSALRFLLTRLHDWIFHPKGALVKPKDPMEYIIKLKWHQTHDIREG